MNLTKVFGASKRAPWLQPLVAAPLLVGAQLLLANLIQAGKYLLLFGPAVLIVYAMVPLRARMALLLFACLFPISLGDIGPVQTFLWAEWMGPLMACVMLRHVIVSRKKIIPERAWLPVSAILVLGIWAAINYYRQPVLAEKLMGVAESAGGLRTYFSIFVGVCIFYSGLWFNAYNDTPKAFWERTLWAIVVFSLSLGILRILSYFLYFDIPFVYGTFRYGSEFTTMLYGGTAYRIGGLSEVATTGLAALLALKSGRTLNIKETALFASFALFLLLSGGRTATVGLLAALLLYGLLFQKTTRFFVWFFFAFSLFLGLLWLFMATDLFSSQLNRLFALQGGFRGQDINRSMAYEYMWRGFLAHPIFGNGVGYYSMDYSDEVGFALSQLKTGGHGSYMSILYLFGLGGIYYLVLILFTSISSGISLLRQGRRLNFADRDVYVMVAFGVIFLVIRSVEYIAGGNGFDDESLFLLAGMLAGTYSRMRFQNGKK